MHAWASCPESLQCDTTPPLQQFVIFLVQISSVHETEAGKVHQVELLCVRKGTGTGGPYPLKMTPEIPTHSRPLVAVWVST